MLNVFFTVDVEIWCDGWTDIDRKFPQAYRQYIEGTTPTGQYGLPFQIALLRDHGLFGVFFVDPMFSLHFGPQPLSDIVGLLREDKQEIQLHLHTEWVDEAIVPVLRNVKRKRQHLRHFSRQEQAILIDTGSRLIKKAGADQIQAFRAGNFAFNCDTLPALSECGIRIDASYNACKFGRGSGLMTGTTLVEPIEIGGVHEYPMTVFDDGRGVLRHAQLGSCSALELEGLLWQALKDERKAFVILSHSVELLSPSRQRVDNIVVRRFRWLCEFLDRNRGSFNVTGFRSLQPESVCLQPAPLKSPVWKTGLRMLEQAYRRSYWIWT